MNLRAYNWSKLKTSERQRIMLDLGYYLLERAPRPIDRLELCGQMRAYCDEFELPELANVTRAQWHRWASAVVNEYADHARANNPRAIEAARFKALARHGRLVAKMERAVDKLLPDSMLASTRRPEGLAQDVRAAAQGVRAIVELDKLSSDLMGWRARAPDEHVTDAAVQAETVRMLADHLAEASPDMRREVLAVAQASLEEQDEGDASVLDQIGLH